MARDDRTGYVGVRFIADFIGPAAYALGESASPVPVEIDNFARARLIVKSTRMHAAETEAVDPDAPPLDLSLELQARGGS